MKEEKIMLIIIIKKKRIEIMNMMSEDIQNIMIIMMIDMIKGNL